MFTADAGTAGVDAGSGPVHMECCDVSMTALLQQQLLLGRDLCVSVSVRDQADCMSKIAAVCCALLNLLCLLCYILSWLCCKMFIPH